MGYKHMIHTADNKALVTGDRLGVVTQSPMKNTHVHM